MDIDLPPPLVFNRAKTEVALHRTRIENEGGFFPRYSYLLFFSGFTVSWAQNKNETKDGLESKILDIFLLNYLAKTVLKIKTMLRQKNIFQYKATYAQFFCNSSKYISDVPKNSSSFYDTISKIEFVIRTTTRDAVLLRRVCDFSRTPLYVFDRVSIHDRHVFLCTSE